jgi:hypothetical protein
MPCRRGQSSCLAQAEFVLQTLDVCGVWASRGGLIGCVYVWADWWAGEVMM